MGTGASLDKKAVLAASGRVGEKRPFFSILLKGLIQHPRTSGLLYGTG